MTSNLRGSCLCGASQYTAGSEIRFSLRCHCSDCRQFSGADSLPQVGVPAENLIPSGPINTYKRKSAAGNDLTFSFCQDCGSALFKSSTMAAGMVFLCAGSLIEPPELSFETQVHTQSAPSWAETSH